MAMLPTPHRPVPAIAEAPTNEIVAVVSDKINDPNASGKNKMPDDLKRCCSHRFSAFDNSRPHFQQRILYQTGNKWCNKK